MIAILIGVRKGCHFKEVIRVGFGEKVAFETWQRWSRYSAEELSRQREQWVLGQKPTWCVWGKTRRQNGCMRGWERRRALEGFEQRRDVTWLLKNPPGAVLSMGCRETRAGTGGPERWPLESTQVRGDGGLNQGLAVEVERSGRSLDVASSKAGPVESPDGLKWNMRGKEGSKLTPNGMDRVTINWYGWGWKRSREQERSGVQVWTCASMS